MKSISINHEQRLFVIPCGGGYSCFGFDNCYRDATAMALMMGVEPPDALSIGTMACYNSYTALCNAFRDHPASKRTWFTPGTPNKVKSVLTTAMNSYRENGKRGQLLRFVMGDTATGRDWCNEWGQVGFIGRTGGSKKVPILLEALVSRDGSIRCGSGGHALLTDCVLRIIDVNTRKDLYRAENYQPPVLAISETAADKKFPFCVSRDGSTMANFKTYGEACEYVAFMLGVTPAKGMRTVKEYEADFADHD